MRSRSASSTRGARATSRLREHSRQRPLPLQQRRPEPDHPDRDALRFHEQPGRGARRVCAGQVDDRPAHAQSGCALRLLEHQFPGTASRARRARAQSEHHVSEERLPGLEGYFATDRGRLRPVRQRQDRRSRSTWAGTSCPAVEQHLHQPWQSGQRDGQLDEPFLERPWRPGHQRRLHPAVRSPQSADQRGVRSDHQHAVRPDDPHARYPIRRCSMDGTSGRTSGSSRQASRTSCCHGSAWMSATSVVRMATSR